MMQIIPNTIETLLPATFFSLIFKPLVCLMLLFKDKTARADDLLMKGS
jgi:hypothetical protein